MKCPRPGRFRRIALGTLLLLPVSWVALVAFVPTECARRTIVERLKRATGREVTLGRVRLGILGGVSLHDLTIGAPRPDVDPWLVVGDASIDVSLRQLLSGYVEPTRVDVRGLRLRVLRRNDGTLELADLLRGAPGSPGTSALPAGGVHEPMATEVRVRDAEVIVLDEPTGSRMVLTGAEGLGTRQGGLITVHELTGRLNGGTIRFAGRLDRTDTEPRYEGQFRLQEVSLRGGMGALAYLVPVGAGVAGDLEGKVTLELYLKGQGDDRGAIRRTLAGHGRILLDPIVLDGSRLLEGLGTVVDLPPRGRIGAVRSDLTIRNGRVATDDLTFDVARVPVVLSGWTDFDGRLDYRLRVEGLVGRLPDKARDLLSELDIDLKDAADVKVRGTVVEPVVTVEGVAVNAPGAGEPGRRLGDRERLREITRRFRDRIRR